MVGPNLDRSPEVPRKLDASHPSRPLRKVRLRCTCKARVFRDTDLRGLSLGLYQFGTPLVWHMCCLSCSSVAYLHSLVHPRNGVERQETATGRERQREREREREREGERERAMPGVYIYANRCMHICMCVYIYICACVYTCLYTHTYVHVCMHENVCICMYMYVCMYVCVCMRVCMYVCVCMRVCMYVCMRVCMYAYMCVYKNMCMQLMVCSSIYGRTSCIIHILYGRAWTNL